MVVFGSTDTIVWPIEQALSKLVHDLIASGSASSRPCDDSYCFDASRILAIGFDRGHDFGS